MAKTHLKSDRSPGSRPKAASTKLTDAQLILLSRAAQREDGAATLPDGVKGNGASKVGQSLIGKGLMREMRAKPQMPIWRKTHDQGAFSLIITKQGRSMISVDGAEESTPVADAGQKRSGEGNASSGASSVAGAPREGRKLAEVISLLRRKQGVSVADLISSTGWLPHTTRAALTGLRKRGYDLERMRPEKGGPSVYRTRRRAGEIPGGLSDGQNIDPADENIVGRSHRG
jgi:hypothetical protein